MNKSASEYPAKEAQYSSGFQFARWKPSLKLVFWIQQKPEFSQIHLLATCFLLSPPYKALNKTWPLLLAELLLSSSSHQSSPATQQIHGWLQLS